MPGSDIPPKTFGSRSGERTYRSVAVNERKSKMIWTYGKAQRGDFERINELFKNCMIIQKHSMMENGYGFQ